MIILIVNPLFTSTFLENHRGGQTDLPSLFRVKPYFILFILFDLFNLSLKLMERQDASYNIPTEKTAVYEKNTN